MTRPEDEDVEAQRKARLAALVARQQEIAKANREKAAKEQEDFGEGDQG